MGFEYGYSLARPDALVMWEAQFGDFVNGAQTIVDEFISSAEQKWGQTSGVTLLLPHGYEGQGPDHSSARIERFLQLCAQNNMTVATPTLPSNYFHLLRWQVHNPHHKPLVVFTPKSMLRLKAAASKTEEFTTGAFRPVIGDDIGRRRRTSARSSSAPARSTTTWRPSGRSAARTDTAIIRIERLYPLPGAELQAEIAKYPNAEKYLWAQEEPANQGALAVHRPQPDRPPGPGGRRGRPARPSGCAASRARTRSSPGGRLGQAAPGGAGSSWCARSSRRKPPAVRQEGPGTRSDPVPGPSSCAAGWVVEDTQLP